MSDITCTSAAMAIALAASLALAAIPAAAQQSKGGGKIVCWKDKSGKVIGCGDSVPPEYQQNASKELDRRGLTRGTTVSAAEEAKRREQEQEQARKKTEEDRRLAEQKRQDSALINTYSNEKEIDQRRNRDLQQVDLQIGELQTSLKNATARHDDIRNRHDAATKSGKPTSDALNNELSRAATDKQKIEESISGREKEKALLSERYAEQKKRFIELRGGPSAAAPTASSAAAKK